MGIRKPLGLRAFLAMFCSAFITAAFLSAASKDKGEVCAPVDITKARATGGFWRKRVEAVAQGSFPNAWRYVDVAVKQVRRVAGLPVEGNVSQGHKWMEANLYKLLEAISYYLAMYKDPDLHNKLNRMIELVSRSQRDDGFIHAWVMLKDSRRAWANLYHQHDGYVQGHLIEAAVAHHQVTGEKSFLKIAGKAASQAYRHFLGGSRRANFKPGKSGNSLQLTGSGRYVDLPEGIISNLGECTISTWVFIHSRQTWARIFDFGTGTEVNMFLTPKSSSGTLRFAITKGGSGDEKQVNAPGLPVGKWKHVALVISEKGAELFVDGVKKAENEKVNLTPAGLGVTTQNYLGKSQYAGDPYLDGRIDDFRIYDEALTGSRIRRLYGSKGKNLSKRSVLPKPVVWYKCDEESGSTLHDSGAAARNGSIEGDSGFPGHAEMELALVRLARETQDERFTELARAFVENRGNGHGNGSYFQDHLPFTEQTEILGHAVRALFFASGVAEIARRTGREDYLAASRALYRSAAHRKLYVTGGAGALHRGEAFGPGYYLPNTGYTESCANCAMADLAWRMVLLGEPGAADVLERCMFNHVLHGISLDGTKYYYRNPLFDRHHPRGNNWCCCPPTLMRTIVKFPMLSYTYRPGRVDINLYGETAAALPVKGRTVTISQETRYPWSGKIVIKVAPGEPLEFTCRCRIPWWCREFSAAVNGDPVKAAPEGGYLPVRRTWKDGDRLQLELKMPVERVAANPKVEANRSRVAVRRGPLVYSLESNDNPDVADPKSVTLPAGPQFSPEYRNDLLGGITVITCKEKRGKKLVFIPFYAVANRNPGPKDWRCVWVRQEGMEGGKIDWQGELYKSYKEPGDL